MNSVDFRKKAIDVLRKLYNSSKEEVECGKENINRLMFRVKNIGSEKGDNLHKFVESVMTLHLDIILDKNVLTINRKCSKIIKA